jgi:endonuclease/exonuclease/phosphatase family metal-dependent hydrolase
MSRRRPSLSGPLLAAALGYILKSRYRNQILLLLALFALVYLLVHYLPHGRSPSARQPTGRPGEFLFCFWNVENLFDDRDDPLARSPDKEFDDWFATDTAARRLKLDRLSEALLTLNGGKGPDILAVAEVEGPRAVELVKEALNAKLSDPALHYTDLLAKEIRSGRHICTAILVRPPLIAGRAQLLDKRLRVLEGRVVFDGRELVVVASHWTSRVSDDDGAGRTKYADLIYGRYRAMARSNPDVNFLVCGDFNDDPTDASVTDHLHAVGDREQVRQATDPHLLLNLMAGKKPAEFGTLYHSGWHVFDQIAVSRGLLDDVGWTCDPDSVSVLNTLVMPKNRLRRPWRFGNERDKAPRGYSDHFPVTVRLRVVGSAE